MPCPSITKRDGEHMEYIITDLIIEFLTDIKTIGLHWVLAILWFGTVIAQYLGKTVALREISKELDPLARKISHAVIYQLLVTWPESIGKDAVFNSLHTTKFTKQSVWVS